MKDQQAGLFALVDKLSHNLENADCVDQIIMGSLLGIKTGLACPGR